MKQPDKSLRKRVAEIIKASELYDDASSWRYAPESREKDMERSVGVLTDRILALFPSEPKEWPECGKSCEVVKEMGVSECENICPKKFPKEWPKKKFSEKDDKWNIAYQTTEDKIYNQALSDCLKVHQSIVAEKDKEIAELKKHDCEEWFDEAHGCSICSQLLLKSPLKSKKEIVDVQNLINAHLNDKDKRIAELEEEKKGWTIEKIYIERDRYKKALEEISMMLDGSKDGVDEIIFKLAHRALKEKP